MEVVREGLLLEMKLELSIEGQNRISHVKTEGRHLWQREQDVQRENLAHSVWLSRV